MEPQLRVLAHGAGSIEWRVEMPAITPRSALRDLLRALLLTAVVSRRRGAPVGAPPRSLFLWWASRRTVGDPETSSQLRLNTLLAKMARTLCG